MPFLLLLLFQKFYFFLKNLLLLSFESTFSKMSVLRFDISVLQIILSPTPLRWVDYSILGTFCQKTLFLCLSVFAWFIAYCRNIFPVFYIYISFALQLCYNIFHSAIRAYSANTFFAISKFFYYIFYIYIFVFWSSCNLFCNY